MTQKFADPHSFLRNLVSRKGRSDLEGVYLTSVSVAADAKADYGYNVPDEYAERSAQSIIQKDQADWHKLLISIRTNPDDIVYPVSFTYCFQPALVIFTSDSSEISCSVTVPSMVLDEFPEEVVIFQKLLRYVAEFAGKVPTTLKFSIGLVTIVWDDMVEYGAAKKVDVGF